MPNFHYIGRDSRGEKSTGSLEAHTAIDAMNQLRRRGLRVERLQSEEDRRRRRNEVRTGHRDIGTGRRTQPDAHRPETADINSGDRGTC